MNKATIKVNFEFTAELENFDTIIEHITQPFEGWQGITHFSVDVTPEPTPQHHENGAADQKVEIDLTGNDEFGI